MSLTNNPSLQGIKYEQMIIINAKFKMLWESNTDHSCGINEWEKGEHCFTWNGELEVEDAGEVISLVYS